MELPNVGKHCDEPTCNELDFLPYCCKCKKVFCAEHYAIHVEECPLMKQHYKVANMNIKSDMWQCSHPGCKEKSLVPLICTKCQQHFCLTHRHITECYREHPAEREAAIAKIRTPIDQFNAAKAKIDQKLDENISAVSKKRAANNKRNEMALKLQLMRIKNKATGQKAIPPADRVYFNITKPQQCGGSTHAVFVARNWSLGRAIDAIADECNVLNRNNLANAKKLHLFTADGQGNNQLNNDLSQTISHLLAEQQLLDGQSLQLEYT